MRRKPILAFLLLSPFAAAPAQQPRPVAATRTLPAAMAMARQVDQLLAAGLRQHGSAPTPRIDDETFLRRAYLAIVGRIPDLRECESFLAEQDPDKRARLVDALLESPGHASHEANFWFDLLRVKSRLRQLSGEPFAHFIRQAILDDVPYDEFVRRMLVADGPAQQEGNGATGFLLRDANMPHDAMANTLRLFLGTRLECAQCHNHPFDRWTQQEFYGMAAFFGGLRYRTEAVPLGPEVRRALQQADDRTRLLVRRTVQSVTTGLAGGGTGMEQLPDDYKYEDATPRSQVFARTIFGANVKLTRTEPARPARRAARPPAAPADVGSRRAFADWLTSKDNPRFAKVAVNRVWQRLFGRGLIDPVDDLKDDTQAVHPALQAHLERLLVELRFDLRQFQRVLLLSDLFQREAVRSDPAADRPFLFEGPLLRRASAEQLWDSLLLLVVPDLDSHLRPPDARAREAYQQFEQAASLTEQQLLQMIREPQLVLQQERERRLAAAQRQPQRPDPEQQERLRALQQALVRARRQNDAAEVERLQRELQQLRAPAAGRLAAGRDELLRASDLPQPAPPGHLLQQFGQSDRETVDAASREANVPQALTMMNGFVDQRIMGASSSLRAALRTAGSPAAQVHAAFLSVLSRRPRADELAAWQPALAAGADEALRDLVWVLCNSNEFRFLR